MTRRERTLLVMAGVVPAIWMLGAGFHRFVREPLRRADIQTMELENTLGALERTQNQARVASNQLDNVARRTFGATPDQAAARAGERINVLLNRVGLVEKEFSRVPTGLRRIRGANEVGWTVQGVGPMARVVDFLYLLAGDSYVHRIEDLTLGPQDVGRVRVSFRYLTLVLDPMPNVEQAELVEEHKLDSPGRKLYAGIVARDLFRPYVKRPPPPPPPPSPPPQPTPPPDPGPGPENYKVISLSQWKGNSEVVVLDIAANKTARYRTGDKLGGGAIVAVDYRTLPRPKKPEIAAHSRVIIEAGSSYWAIDSGDTLADKYRLAPDRLPPAVVARRDSSLKDQGSKK